jgi:hypothetical protein
MKYTVHLFSQGVTSWEAAAPGETTDFANTKRAQILWIDWIVEGGYFTPANHNIAARAVFWIKGSRRQAGITNPKVRSTV